MEIIKIADGAYFVPSFSTQTIIQAYDTKTTIQSFGAGAFEVDGPQVINVDAANNPSTDATPDAPEPRLPR